MQAAVKKDIGLEEKLVGRSGRVDETKQVQADGNIDELMTTFAEMMKVDYEDAGKIKESMESNQYTHEQVVNFFASSIVFEESENYYYSLGEYVSKLIQNSSVEKWDFPKYLPGAHNLGSNLSGNYILNIECEVGEYLGFCSKSSEFNVFANVGKLAAEEAKNCLFRFFADVDFSNFASNAENCTFEFHLPLNYKDGQSSCIGAHAEGCTYKVWDKDNVGFFRRRIGSGSRLIYVSKGKEEIVRDYGG